MKPGDTIGNDRSPDMNRVERAIVRGLRDEFGKGQQHQVGDAAGFTIAVAGTDVVIKVGEQPLPKVGGWGDYDDDEPARPV